MMTFAAKFLFFAGNSEKSSEILNFLGISENFWEFLENFGKFWKILENFGEI
jgi:hypothetical protein